MRIEVIADGKSLERHEFISQPRTGDVIQMPAGEFVVDSFCHNLTANRLQVRCSNAKAYADKGATVMGTKRNQPATTVQS